MTASVIGELLQTAEWHGRELHVRGPVLNDEEGVQIALALALLCKFQLDSIVYMENSELQNCRILVLARKGIAQVPWHFTEKGETILGFAPLDEVPIKLVQCQSRGPHIDFSDRGMFSGEPYIVLRGCVIDRYVRSAFPVLLLQDCRIGTIEAPSILSDGTSLVQGQRLAANLPSELAAEIQVLESLKHS